MYLTYTNLISYTGYARLFFHIKWAMDVITPKTTNANYQNVWEVHIKVVSRFPGH